jgi:hypothetical protein
MMKILNSLLFTNSTRTEELEKKLRVVEHELDYTISSKNILTLNNHAKDRRITELTTAVEEKTAQVLRQKKKLCRASYLVNMWKGISDRKEGFIKEQFRVLNEQDTLISENDKTLRNACIVWVISALACLGIILLKSQSNY